LFYRKMSHNEWINYSFTSGTVKCPRNNIVQINSSLYMHCVSWLSDSWLSNIIIFCVYKRINLKKGFGVPLEGKGKYCAYSVLFSFTCNNQHLHLLIDLDATFPMFSNNNMILLFKMLVTFLLQNVFHINIFLYN
jgi:hypothetical protein